MKLLDLNQLSTKLKLFREAKGWTKSEMARRLQISSQLYGQYENGEKTPKIDFATKWRETFGEDLLNEDETVVSRETTEAEVKPTPKDKKLPLEQAVLNLSETELRNSRNMEELIALLKYQMMGKNPQLVEPGTRYTEDLKEERKKAGE